MSDPTASLNETLTFIRQVAAEAGAAILEIAADDGIEYKHDDSPITRADLASNEVILARLRERFPDDAILSEESPDDPRRATQRRVWIIDPIDGTRDFIAQTGDYAVHIGLAIDGRPVLGVVHQPQTGETRFAVEGGGAFTERGGVITPLKVSTTDDLAALRVGVSRQYLPENVQGFLSEAALSARVQHIGASIKMMALAAGELELCVWLHGKEKLWDTCAPEIIVKEAGGIFTDIDGQSFTYDVADVHHRRGVVVSNNACHAELLKQLRPWFA